MIDQPFGIGMEGAVPAAPSSSDLTDLTVAPALAGGPQSFMQPGLLMPGLAMSATQDELMHLHTGPHVDLHCDRFVPGSLGQAPAAGQAVPAGHISGGLHLMTTGLGGATAQCEKLRQLYSGGGGGDGGGGGSLHADAHSTAESCPPSPTVFTWHLPLVLLQVQGWHTECGPCTVHHAVCDTGAPGAAGSHLLLDTLQCSGAGGGGASGYGQIGQIGPPFGPV